MKNGSPTVKWITLFLLVAFLSSLNFLTDHTKAQAVSRAADKVSLDLIELAQDTSSNRRVTVIIQFNGNPGSTFDCFLSSNSGRAKGAFLNFNAQAVELPARALEALANQPEVAFISLDREIIPFGHVSLTTGA